MALRNLKEQVQSRKSTNTEVTSLVNVSLDSLEKIIYSDDIEINEYLHKKTVEITTLNSTGSLILGRIFTEVKEKLKDTETTYTNWLSENGYNKMTALRHCNRYMLHETVKTEKAKETVAILPVKLISAIVRKENFERYIDLLDQGYTVNEIKSDFDGYIKSLPPKDEGEDKEDDTVSIDSVIDFGSYMKVLDFITDSGRLDNLETSKKKELAKYLSKIMNILGEDNA